MKTVVGLYDDFHEAQDAINALLTREYPREDISVLANNVGGEVPSGTDVAQRDLKREAMGAGARIGAGTGAVLGTGAGGVFGLLVGLGTIVLPGVGPVLAAGPVLSLLTGAGVGAAAGAALGGIVGALMQVGLPEHDAQFYLEAVRRGGTVVIVRAADDAADEVAGLLRRNGAVDVDKRREHFAATGYSGYTHEARAFTVDDIARERALHRAETAAKGG
jgi:hypothetical protein